MEETSQAHRVKDPKTKTGKHKVPVSAQSTWKLALCVVLVLNQGWNITQTLATPNTSGMVSPSLRNTSHPPEFPVTTQAVFFSLELDKTHLILSTTCLLRIDRDPHGFRSRTFFVLSTGFLEKKYFQSLCVEGNTQRNAQAMEDASELHCVGQVGKPCCSWEARMWNGRMKQRLYEQQRL